MRKYRIQILYLVLSCTIVVSLLLVGTSSALPQDYPTPTYRSNPTEPGGIDTLAVFSGGWVSLISTLVDYSEPWHVEEHGMSAPAGQWVMGDWDGDGQKSPGVYGKGKLYFTNSLEKPEQPTIEQLQTRSDWLQIWIGPQGRSVAGRFRDDIANDCIGVVEESTSGTDTVYVLWYTCDFSVEAPVIEGQLIGKALPKVNGLMDFGTPQFVVGDWDGDGIETIAFRQGRFFNYSNTPPTEETAVFEERVVIGLPRQDGYSILVAGDWEDDGVDTIGLYYFYATWAVYADGIDRPTPFHEFYYCNTLVCSDEGYIFIRVRTTLDPTNAPEFLNVVSWRDNRPPRP